MDNQWTRSLLESVGEKKVVAEAEGTIQYDIASFHEDAIKALGDATENVVRLSATLGDLGADKIELWYSRCSDKLTEVTTELQDIYKRVEKEIVRMGQRVEEDMKPLDSLSRPDRNFIKTGRADDAVSVKEIKQKLKGYKVSVRAHKLVRNAVKIYITTQDGAKVYGDFDVYDKEFREEHKQALDYVTSLKGMFLDTGEKII